MKQMYRWIILVLILASLLSACAPKASSTTKVSPVTLEPIEGTDFQRVILTEKAAQRLDIKTAEVEWDLDSLCGCHLRHGRQYLGIHKP